MPKYEDQMWSICLNAQIKNVVVVYINMLSDDFFFLVLYNTIHIFWILQNHNCFHIQIQNYSPHRIDNIAARGMLKCTFCLDFRKEKVNSYGLKTKLQYF